MKTITKLLSALLVLTLCLGCCAYAAESPEVPDPADMFTDRDYDVSYTDWVTVTLADGASAADGAGVAVQGDTVTITEAGVYLLTGELTNGQLLVAAPEDAKVQLVLDGVSVTCEGGAALYIQSGDKVFLTTAPDSENTLRSTGDLTQEDGSVDGAVFSRIDLTLNGEGLLTVSSESGHGVECKDDLKITSGAWVIDAARDGMNANDSICIAGGEITVTAGSDGLEASHEDPEKGFLYLCGGVLAIDCENDALEASSTVTILGGSLTVTAGGGRANGPEHTDFWSMPGFGGFASENAWEESETDPTGSDSHKGIKAGASILIAGGEITLDTADDGVHSDGDVTISGGSLTVTGGDDGVHADNALTVTGGSLSIDAYEGLEALTVLISGGEIDLLTEDDGINASGGSAATLTVSGGVLRVDSEGDSLDANGSLYVTGGEISISGPTNGGNGILDYDYTGSVTGGTVISVGATGMEINFGQSSTQGSILYTLAASQPAGTVVTLTDAAGQVIAEYTPEKAFQAVLVSAAGIQAGETYTLTVGSQSYEIEMTSLLYGAGGFGGASGGMAGASGEFGGSAGPRGF